MSRIYAIEEISGKRILVRLECDGLGCDAKIKPHPEIAKSGWTKAGTIGGELGSTQFDYCPDCWSKHGYKY